MNSQSIVVLSVARLCLLAPWSGHNYSIGAGVAAVAVTGKLAAGSTSEIPSISSLKTCMSWILQGNITVTCTVKSMHYQAHQDVV